MTTIPLPAGVKLAGYLTYDEQGHDEEFFKSPLTDADLAAGCTQKPVYTFTRLTLPELLPLAREAAIQACGATGVAADRCRAGDFDTWPTVVAALVGLSMGHIA